MIGLSPAPRAFVKKSYAPKRFPWSVIAMADMPRRLASVIKSSSRAAPSSIEYSVCTWRWTKSSDVIPIPHRSPSTVDSHRQRGIVQLYARTGYPLSPTSRPAVAPELAQDLSGTGFRTTRAPPYADAQIPNRLACNHCLVSPNSFATVGSAPYVTSPTHGWRIAAMWTRIWCVRPVSRCTSTRDARGHASSVS